MVSCGDMMTMVNVVSVAILAQASGRSAFDSSGSGSLGQVLAARARAIAPLAWSLPSCSFQRRAPVFATVASLLCSRPRCARMAAAVVLASEQRTPLRRACVFAVLAPTPRSHGRCGRDRVRAALMSSPRSCLCCAGVWPRSHGRCGRASVCVALPSSQ